MEPNQIIKYPLLLNSSMVTTQVDAIKKAKEQLTTQIENFEKSVTNLQNDCKHSFQKVMEFDKTYHWGTHSPSSGDDVMKGKECTECGLFEPRPKGFPWDICHKCGGEMEYQGKTPGQGGDGQHIYKCKSCSHVVSHT